MLEGPHYNSFGLTVVVEGTVEFAGTPGLLLQIALSGGIVNTYIIISRM